MALAPLLGTVPAGTIVQISIKVPHRNDGVRDGFAYAVATPMSAAALRAAIDSELVPKFFDQFLPAE